MFGLFKSGSDVSNKSVTWESLREMIKEKFPVFSSEDSVERLRGFNKLLVTTLKDHIINEKIEPVDSITKYGNYVILSDGTPNEVTINILVGLFDSIHPEFLEIQKLAADEGIELEIISPLSDLKKDGEFIYDHKNTFVYDKRIFALYFLPHFICENFVDN